MCCGAPSFQYCQAANLISLLTSLHPNLKFWLSRSKKVLFGKSRWRCTVDEPLQKPRGMYISMYLSSDRPNFNSQKIVGLGTTRGWLCMRAALLSQRALHHSHYDQPWFSKQLFAIAGGLHGWEEKPALNVKKVPFQNGPRLAVNPSKPIVTYKIHWLHVSREESSLFIDQVAQ